MGKGARTREANAPKLREKREKQQQEAARRRRKSWIVRGCTAVVALILVGALVITGVQKVSLDNGTKMRQTIVAESENYSIDGAMFSYFVHYYYQNYLNTYGSYLSLIGLDTNKSLKSQVYSESDGKTWFDMFAESAETMSQQYLVLNEAAKEAGMTLTDKEKEIVDSKAAAFDTTGFGRGVTNEDMKHIFDLSVIASKFYQSKLAEFEPSSEEIEKAYNEDPKAYQYVDYYSYTLAYQDESDSSSSSASSSSETEKMSKEEAKKLADELAGCKDNQAFVDWVVNYTKESADEEPSQEDLDKIPTNILKTGASYTADDKVSEWAFGAKANETFIYENEETKSYTVYSLKSEAARREDNTVNVRHILVETKEEAQSILDTFLAGDKTEESFGLLAFEYSTDSGSVDYGGLYENVYNGQMVEAFNDWCFDENRKVGDTEIVETDYGYHVMLFCGEGLTRWQSEVRGNLVNDAYTAYYEDLKENYPVTFYSDRYDVIEA